jgi:uncharacterized membrane-anchored protein YhcB (DUF1043 family)
MPKAKSKKDVQGKLDDIVARLNGIENEVKTLLSSNAELLMYLEELYKVNLRMKNATVRARVKNSDNGEQPKES